MPFTGVEIEHSNARPIVTTPTRAMFYNRGQCYRRHLLDRSGDRCLFFGIEPTLLGEILEANEARWGDDPARPFTSRCGPMDPTAFVRAVELSRCVADGSARPDSVFERVVELFDALVTGALPARSPKARRLKVGRKAQDAVEETLRQLMLKIDEPATLAQLGARVGLSPFYLARSFRACTGMSLHECRERIRVLYALNRLESSTRLVDIAMDAGFSSHSHLTQAFRRVLRQTPSELRRRLYRTRLSS